eukprot:333567-Amphidinium_carterae.1
MEEEKQFNEARLLKEAQRTKEQETAEEREEARLRQQRRRPQPGQPPHQPKREGTEKQSKPDRGTCSPTPQTHPPPRRKRRPSMAQQLPKAGRVPQRMAHPIAVPKVLCESIYGRHFAQQQRHSIEVGGEKQDQTQLELLHMPPHQQTSC